MSYGRKGAFDVIKGIACFAVVLIHFNVKGEIGEVVKAAARFAVPTFSLLKD
jgi:surface polysaccharide O-acyltransferase-like enzyme